MYGHWIPLFSWWWSSCHLKCSHLTDYLAARRLQGEVQPSETPKPSKFNPYRSMTSSYWSWSYKKHPGLASKRPGFTWFYWVVGLVGGTSLLEMHLHPSSSTHFSNLQYPFFPSSGTHGGMGISKRWSKSPSVKEIPREEHRFVRPLGAWRARGQLRTVSVPEGRKRSPPKTV